MYKSYVIYVLFSYKKRCKDSSKRPYEGGVAAPIRNLNPALIDTLCNLVPRQRDILDPHIDNP